MNTRPFLSRTRVLLVSALLAVAGTSQAGGVSWSVGINAPVVYGPQVSAVVSGGQGYRYMPPPPPVYVQPQVVVPQLYYPGPQPVLYQPPPHPVFRPFFAWGHWHHHGHAEAYADGYRRGYEHGYDRGSDDDRRGAWAYRGDR